MATGYLRLISFLSIFFCLSLPAAGQARETDFRLIYIGSLSGYVNLCG